MHQIEIITKGVVAILQAKVIMPLAFLYQGADCNHLIISPPYELRWFGQATAADPKDNVIHLDIGKAP